VLKLVNTCIIGVTGQLVLDFDIAVTERKYFRTSVEQGVKNIFSILIRYRVSYRLAV